MSGILESLERSCAGLVGHLFHEWFVCSLGLAESGEREEFRNKKDFLFLFGGFSSFVDFLFFFDDSFEEGLFVLIDLDSVDSFIICFVCYYSSISLSRDLKCAQGSHITNAFNLICFVFSVSSYNCLTNQVILVSEALHSHSCHLLMHIFCSQDSCWTVYLEVLFVGGETAKGELESTDEIDVTICILVAFKSSDGAVFIESSFSELVVSSLS